VLKAAPPAAVDARLDWPAELEREIELYRAHPELDPWRPKFLADFTTQEWRALLMEDLGASLRPPPWTETAVDQVSEGLAALHSATASRGGCFVHGDVRSDNLFVALGRGLVLCDWAEADLGCGFEDAIYWAIGVALESGRPAPDVFAKYTAFAGDPDSGAISRALARLAQMNQQRLQRRGEPAAVRELRSRELDVVRRWRDVYLA
jgi:aminoglycoside phosphotransferase (APT) family kinase protein